MRTPFNCKLNDYLLSDPNVCANVTQELTNFFAGNTTGDCDDLTIWEAHKAFIRDVFIKHGAWVKKLRLPGIQALVLSIHELEQKHKTFFQAETLAELTRQRDELRSLTLHKSRAVLARCRKTYYEHGDKCGHLLAMTLKGTRSRSYVSGISTAHNGKVHKTEEIADAFRTYYQSVYNISDGPSGEMLRPSRETIESYLKESGLQNLPMETVEGQDGHITQEQFEGAIYGMRTGKAPGPYGFVL